MILNAIVSMSTFLPPLYGNQKRVVYCIVELFFIFLFSIFWIEEFRKEKETTFVLSSSAHPTNLRSFKTTTQTHTHTQHQKQKQNKSPIFFQKKKPKPKSQKPKQRSSSSSSKKRLKKNKTIHVMLLLFFVSLISPNNTRSFLFYKAAVGGTRGRKRLEEEKSKRCRRCRRRI